ncbi:MAG: nuclear transport factor 2 family protein [Gammaproteobacteria bacterium]|jgi:ketosteroid isomerase-like protein
MIKPDFPVFATSTLAEQAFYKAFAECDFKAMNSVWAEDDVICIHPGSTALVGREAVMRSWINILADAEPPNLKVEVISRVMSENLAIHVVREYIAAQSGESETIHAVLATNVYRNNNANGWHLLAHHASAPGLQESDAGSTGVGTNGHHTLQ